MAVCLSFCCTRVHLYTIGGPDDKVVQENPTAAYCLLLPGRKLYLSPLLAMKKFRNKGNKEGAIRAMHKLEDEGLGKVLIVSGSRGNSQVCM